MSRSRKLAYGLLLGMGGLLVAMHVFSWAMWTEEYSVQAAEAPSFVQPTAEERFQAVGDLKSVPTKWRPFFQPTERDQPVPDPGPSDWLANHPESQQSFDVFLGENPNRPDRTRDTIYLVPLEEFDADAPVLEELREFMQRFFAMPAKLLPMTSFPSARITQRTLESTGREQWLTTDLLRELQPLVPRNAYCLLGITMTDLYPDPKWNYVFGQATLKQRVGVYSLARFDPAFFGDERPADWKQLVFRRSCELIAHETGHMFGLRHCVYYRCVMNGCNHQGEADATPLRPCPVCLRKLHWSVRFDPEKRARELREFFDSRQMSDRPLAAEMTAQP